MTVRNHGGQQHDVMTEGTYSGSAMASTLIILLGLVLSALIAGVFLMAMVALRQIDEVGATPELTPVTPGNPGD